MKLAQVVMAAFGVTVLIPDALGSLKFTRDGQKALVPFQRSMDWTGDLTLEVWIKPDAACSTRFYNYVVSRNYGNLGYGLCIQGHATKLTNLGGNAVIPFDKWTHLAVCMSSKARKLYVNGQLAYADAGDARPHAGGALPLYIGTSNFQGEPGDQPTQFFGEISEVRVWKIALDQDQVRASMSHRIRANGRKILAYFPLDEDKGMLVHDASGHLMSGHLGDDYTADDNDPEWSKDEPPTTSRLRR